MALCQHARARRFKQGCCHGQCLDRGSACSPAIPRYNTIVPRPRTTGIYSSTLATPSDCSKKETPLIRLFCLRRASETSMYRKRSGTTVLLSLRRRTMRQCRFRSFGRGVRANSATLSGRPCARQKRALSASSEKTCAYRCLLCK